MICVHVFVLLGCLIMMLAMYLVLETRQKTVNFLKNTKLVLAFAVSGSGVSIFSDVVTACKYYWETVSSSGQLN